MKNVKMMTGFSYEEKEKHKEKIEIKEYVTMALHKTRHLTGC